MALGFFHLDKGGELCPSTGVRTHLPQHVQIANCNLFPRLSPCLAKDGLLAGGFIN